jgi:hypothetical protein
MSESGEKSVVGPANITVNVEVNGCFGGLEAQAYQRESVVLAHRMG